MILAKEKISQTQFFPAVLRCCWLRKERTKGQRVTANLQIVLFPASIPDNKIRGGELVESCRTESIGFEPCDGGWRYHLGVAGTEGAEAKKAMITQQRLHLWIEKYRSLAEKVRLLRQTNRTIMEVQPYDQARNSPFFPREKLQMQPSANSMLVRFTTVQRPI
jgi:hypothetical protein